PHQPPPGILDFKEAEMGAKGMGTWLFLFFSDGADGMETCGWSRGGDKGLLLRAQGSCLRRMHPLPGASVMRGWHF
ncbi:Os10g0172600, partial [Oryza sativa Japonica Group]